MGEALSRLSLKLGSTSRDFFFRDASTGDKGAIQQVLINKDYGLAPFAQGRQVRDSYEALVAEGRLPLILDAGANIGASVVWFTGDFPASRVLAIEPERENCKLLRKNCEGLNYALLEGGIGGAGGTACLQDPGISDWGYRLGASGLYEVPVFAAADILEREITQGAHPFIAKIDIEGGEAELFSRRTEWLEGFALVVIELHDWMFPGSASSRNFLRVVAAGNFDVVQRGENTFCFNNDVLKRG